MRGDEVLQHRQALAEVGLDRARNDLALGVGHETAHTGDLADLHEVSAGTRVDHHEDRVLAREVVLHGPGNLVRGASPDLDELLATLRIGDETALVLRLHLGGTLFRGREQLGLLGRRDDVVDGDGDTGARRPVEAELLEGVERRSHVDLRVTIGELIDEAAERLLVDLVVDVGEVGGKRLVEDRAPERGLQDEGIAQGPALGRRPALGRHDVGQAQAHGLLQAESAAIEGHDGLGERGEGGDLLARCRAGHREVVDAEDHVLGRRRDRSAVGRREDVVARQHEDACLGLSLSRQRQVHGHLVPVEVGVERRADERMDLDGLALDELRLEGLDAEAVKGRRAVEQHRVLRDDLFEHVPHDRA